MELPSWELEACPRESTTLLDSVYSKVSRNQNIPYMWGHAIQPERVPNDLVSQVIITLVWLSWPWPLLPTSSWSQSRCHAWCPSQEGAWAWGLNLSLGWRKSLSRRPPPLPRRKERRRNVDGWVWPYCVEQSRNIVRIGLLLFSDVFRQKSKLTCFSWTWNCNICRIPIHLLVVLSLFLLFSYHLFWCIGAYS